MVGEPDVLLDIVTLLAPLVPSVNSPSLVILPSASVFIAPISFLNWVAVKGVTVLFALNLGYVIALGLVNVNILLPISFAPKLYLAANALIAPVPPFAIGNVPSTLETDTCKLLYVPDTSPPKASVLAI